MSSLPFALPGEGTFSLWMKTLQHSQLTTVP